MNRRKGFKYSIASLYLFQIHVIAANGYKSALKALMKYDPDVNILDSYGWTPLHVAARFNQVNYL